MYRLASALLAQRSDFDHCDVVICISSLLIFDSTFYLPILPLVGIYVLSNLYLLGTFLYCLCGLCLHFSESSWELCLGVGIYTPTKKKLPCTFSGNYAIFHSHWPNMGVMVTIHLKHTWSYPSVSIILV